MRRATARLSAFTLAAMSLVACASTYDPQPPLPEAPLAVATPRGPVRLMVELATSAEEQEMGLMFRTHLADKAGMLFVFAKPQMETFWMRNTSLALDMIFIRADGTISSIHDHALPLDERTISSTEPVRYVLEIKAGEAAALGIAPGQHVGGPAINRGH